MPIQVNQIQRGHVPGNTTFAVQHSDRNKIYCVQFAGDTLWYGRGLGISSLKDKGRALGLQSYSALGGTYVAADNRGQGYAVRKTPLAAGDVGDLQAGQAERGWQAAEHAGSSFLPKFLLRYVGKTHDWLLTALPLYDGDLTQCSPDRRMARAPAYAFLLQVCQQLTHLHGNGLVVNGIRLSKVLFKIGNPDSDQQTLTLTLSDFSHSARNGEVHRADWASAAPELVSAGKLNTANAQTCKIDMWAVGVALAQLLLIPLYSEATMRLLHDAQAADSNTLKAALRQEHQTLTAALQNPNSELRQTIKSRLANEATGREDGLTDIILGLLRIRPGKRWSARQVLDTLGTIDAPLQLATWAWPRSGAMHDAAWLAQRVDEEVNPADFRAAPAQQPAALPVAPATATSVVRRPTDAPAAPYRRAAVVRPHRAGVVSRSADERRAPVPPPTVPAQSAPAAAPRVAPPEGNVELRDVAPAVPKAGAVVTGILVGVSTAYMSACVLGRCLHVGLFVVLPSVLIIGILSGTFAGQQALHRVRRMLS